MHMFLPYGDVKGLCMPVCTSVTIHIDSVYAVCLSLKSVRLWGLSGELGLNLNAGHCAAYRFRFRLSTALCAQDGNPSNTARIPVKSNNLLPPSAIEARQLRGDRCCTRRTWQVIMQSAMFPHFDVFQRVWT